MEKNNIQFTRPKLLAFKRAYAGAVEDKEDVFSFEGHEFLVSYARYLIEYLEVNL